MAAEQREGKSEAEGVQMKPTTDNLDAYVEFLRARGLPNVKADIFCDHDGSQAGITIDSTFYPLWELNVPENSASLDRLDFERIRKNRPMDWSPHLAVWQRRRATKPTPDAQTKPKDDAPNAEDFDLGDQGQSGG